MKRERATIRRVLGWMGRVPFFVMPAAFTLFAYDVYGGFAYHARVAALLGAVGAIVGLAETVGGEARGVESLARAVAPVTALLTMVALGLVALAASTAVADGLGALLRGVEVPPAHAGVPAPLVFVVLFVAAVARPGRHALSCSAAQPFAGLVGWLSGVWAAVVTLAPEVPAERSSIVWIGLGILLAATAARGPRVVERPRWRSWLRLGILLPLVAAGPVLGRYVSAAAVPLLVNDRVVAVVGGLVGLGIGASIVLLWRDPHFTATSLGRRLVIVALAPWLLTYTMVFYALSRPWFFCAAAAVLVLFVAIRAIATARGDAPPLRLAHALWLFFYVAFGWTVCFKSGPRAADCSAVIASTPARVLLARHAEGGDYASSDPYDVWADAPAGALVVTFKRTDPRGGFVEALDLERPTQPTARARLVVRRPDASGPLWPERFSVDPRTGLYYFGILGRGAFSLWEVGLGREPGGRLAFRVPRSAPLAWEPSTPDVDVTRGWLVQPYLSGQSGDAPLLEAIDLGDLQPGRRVFRGPTESAMAEFVAVDPGSSRYYVPTTHHFVRFELLLLDPAGGELRMVRRVETYHPTIGLAVDRPRHRVYATNPLGGTIVVYDPDSLAPEEVLRSGAFPRDLELDRERDRLYVGNYGDGTVSVFTAGGGADGATPQLLRRVPVGSLLRGLSLDHATGRVYAASACGVFQIDR